MNIEISELLSLQIISAFGARIGKAIQIETRSEQAELAEEFISALPECDRDNARDLLQQSITLWTSDTFREHFSLSAAM